MKSSQQEKVHEILREIKQKSAVTRLIYANKFVMIVSIFKIIAEVVNYGIYENTSERIITLISLTCHYSLPSVLGKYEKYAKAISFIFADVISYALIILAYTVQPQNELFWVQLAVITSFFYQSYLFSNVTYLILFSIKQALI